MDEQASERLRVAFGYDIITSRSFGGPRDLGLPLEDGVSGREVLPLGGIFHVMLKPHD
jgi:hypothetical protein